jgi:hypothetical protein
VTYKTKQKEGDAMRKLSVLFVTAWLALPALAQTPYKLPPKVVVDILDAPPTPFVFLSPRNDAMLLVDYRPHPSIELLAQPFLKLGGLRVNPELGSRQRLTQLTRLSVKWLQTGKTVAIEAPSDAKLGLPHWSYDGTRLAFTHDLADGVELWIADAATGKAKALSGVRVNDVLTSPFGWTRDNTHLRVLLVPSTRGKVSQYRRNRRKNFQNGNLSGLAQNTTR